MLKASTSINHVMPIEAGNVHESSLTQTWISHPTSVTFELILKERWICLTFGLLRLNSWCKSLWLS